MQIYESYGHSQRDAAKSILENNIFGLDIDNRAYQLSYFALMMKARYYNRRILDGSQKAQVYSIQESNSINRTQLDFCGANLSDFERNTAKLQAMKLIETFVDAKEYGSILNVEPMNWELLNRFVDDVDFGSQMSLEAIGIEETQKKIRVIIQIAEVMERKYDVVVTNPPYMGASSMSAKLSEFLKNYNSTSKSDLFAAFIDKGCRYAKINGFNSMVTMQSWMFLSSYEKLRESILNKLTINNLMHMDNMVMGIAFGTSATVIRNTSCKDYKGTYNHVSFKDIDKNNKPFEFPIRRNRIAQVSSRMFSTIPGAPVAYWVSHNLLNVYHNGKPLGEIAAPRKGNSTSNNDKFLRIWHEVDTGKINFDAKVINRDESKKRRWYPYNKGGGFRKWYGLNEYLIDWFDDAKDIRAIKTAVIANYQYFMKPGLTWSTVTSGDFSIRWFDEGFIFDNGGCCIFELGSKRHYLLGLLNSKVFKYIFGQLNPTLNFQSGEVAKFPILLTDNTKIDDFVDDNVRYSKDDWDSFEKSWDFKRHKLIKDQTISNAYKLWLTESELRFNQLKTNEEELNSIFIEIYGLQDELRPEVDEKDVTVRKADLGREIRSFISYAAGCMFGRYSLDVEGIAYAGGEWDDSKYTKFIPDKDNCIPITDDEYFKDDILTRFIEFVRVVYGPETLEENLDFIANAIGGKGNSSREIIRNYFVKDFYKDHVKTYQKRPIYWLYDSGKQDGFKALIYMHRYTEDTTGIVRVDYLHALQKKYATEIENLKDLAAKTDNAREAAQAQKRIEKLKKQLNETEIYDEKLGHLALSRIAIDLDDGVKVNYEKVQTDAEGHKYEILAKI